MRVAGAIIRGFQVLLLIEHRVVADLVVPPPIEHRVVADLTVIDRPIPAGVSGG